MNWQPLSKINSQDGLILTRKSKDYAQLFKSPCIESKPAPWAESGNETEDDRRDFEVQKALKSPPNISIKPQFTAFVKSALLHRRLVKSNEGTNRFYFGDGLKRKKLYDWVVSAIKFIGGELSKVPKAATIVKYQCQSITYCKHAL